MKILLCFGAVAALCAFAMAYTEGQLAEFSKIAKGCIESSGVNIEDVKKARKNEYVDCPKMAAYVFCAYTGVGLVDKTGKMIPAMFKEKAPKSMDPKDVDERIKKCENEQGSSPQDTAYAVFKCLKLGSNVELDGIIN